MTTSTTGGTELVTVLATANDDVTNRSTQFPTGAILKKIRVDLWSTTDPAPAGKHQCMMLYQPGAASYTSNISNWFLSTNPITNAMKDVRANVLGKRPGVHTTVVSGTTAFPVHMVCYWSSGRGGKVMHDGDDIILAQLDAVSTAWTGTCDYSFIR